MSNLRIFAAGKSFGVQQLAEVRLLSGAVDLKAGSLPDVKLSLIGYHLELLVSSNNFRDKRLLNF